MQPRPDRLDVFYGSDHVGTVRDSVPLAFEYAPAWLAGTQRMTLAAIPLQSGWQATPEVQAFFENLLPEGELRDYLAAHSARPPRLFSLLLEVAGDNGWRIRAGGALGRTPELRPGTRRRPGRRIAALLAKRSAVGHRHPWPGRAHFDGRRAGQRPPSRCSDNGIPQLPQRHLPLERTSSSPTSAVSPRCGTLLRTRRS